MASPQENQTGRVDQFLVEQLDSVPQLEALLQVWQHRPKSFGAEEIAHVLYISGDRARDLLQGLHHRGLLERLPEGRYRYHGQNEQTDGMMEEVALAYRRDLVRISKLIHAKSSALGEFARAFDLRNPRS